MSDRLDAMQAFVAVCDTNGFASAARKLRLSPSAVTRLINALEERLGVRLLQRTTRRVRLTDAGARFLERARRILAEVEEAERSALNERLQPRGTLTIAAPLLFGRMHVAPLILPLFEAHPHVSVDLQLSDRMSNLVEDGIDVAIRIGALADSGVIARRLGQTQRIMVASPAYLAANGGAPASPAGLVQHRLISFQPMVPMHQWTFRDARDAPLMVDAVPRLVTNSGDTAIDHAVKGGGIAAAFCYQVEAALRSGDLVEVLKPFAPPPVPIQAVFPTSRLLSSKVRAFLDLAERAAVSWTFLSPVVP